MNSAKFFIPLIIILLTGSFGLAKAGQESAANSRYEDVPSGTLVLPRVRDNDSRQAGSSRKCMKVCKQWGESCIIDPRTGSRKCRRTCKQFGVECFD